MAQIKGEIRRLIKMDAVHPIIILKIIQNIDLLGPMFAFNKQDMIDDPYGVWL